MDRQTLIELAKVKLEEATEEQLVTLIVGGPSRAPILPEEPGNWVMPEQMMAQPLPKPEPKKKRGRGPKYTKTVPILKPIDNSGGRATPQRMLDYLRQDMNIPTDMGQVMFSIMKFGKKLTRWPDGSYSRLNFRGTVPPKAASSPDNHVSQ
jgi:hypothetical protein